MLRLNDLDAYDESGVQGSLDLNPSHARKLLTMLCSLGLAAGAGAWLVAAISLMVFLLQLRPDWSRLYSYEPV